MENSIPQPSKISVIRFLGRASCLLHRRDLGSRLLERRDPPNYMPKTEAPKDGFLRLVCKCGSHLELIVPRPDLINLDGQSCLVWRFPDTAECGACHREYWPTLISISSSETWCLRPVIKGEALRVCPHDAGILIS